LARGEVALPTVAPPPPPSPWLARQASTRWPVGGGERRTSRDQRLASPDCIRIGV